MINKFLPCVLPAALLATQAASAQDALDGCEALGLTNAYTQAYFCAELDKITEADTPTRGIGDAEDETLPPGLSDVDVIRDAYRADPRKTLELIKRIRNAGGLPEQ
ncbi:MAG: hypothetical protein AAGF74_11205 [Pseudomonadota bacterium]